MVLGSSFVRVYVLTLSLCSFSRHLFRIWHCSSLRFTRQVSSLLFKINKMFIMLDNLQWGHYWLSPFMQSHIRVLETTQDNVNALLMGLEYLISISYVDDTEVFKVWLIAVLSLSLSLCLSLSLSLFLSLFLDSWTNDALWTWLYVWRFA